MRALAVAAVAIAVACGACSSAASRSTTELAIRVTDGASGPPLAARVLLFGEDGKPLKIGTVDLFGARQGKGACELAPGAIGTLLGIVVAPTPTSAPAPAIPIGVDRCEPSPAIPYGTYKVWAWHGIDHERWEGTVDLRADRGRVELTIPLERAWTASDALAADLHVHAEASNDSNMPNAQRVLAQLAGGVQVTALSNHNTAATAAPAIAALGVGSAIAAIGSIEVTSDHAHFGVYPVSASTKVDDKALAAAKSPAEVLAIARALTGTGSAAPIVQVNHPRFRVTAMFDETHWDGVAWPPPFPLGFDAVEVINGFTAFDVPRDRRIDDSVRDLYTFVDHGHPVAAMGNSDTHDFNWVEDGAARTFVFGVALPLDEAAFVAAIRAHHTEATTGPYLRVHAASTQAAATGGAGVGPGELVAAADGKVWLDITVFAAKFVQLDRLRITVGASGSGGGGAPVVAQTIPLTHGQREFHWAGAVDVGTAGDTWIGVTADGDTPLPLEQTGTYQHDKWKRAGDSPYAVISPIRVDVDGDGHWQRGDAR